jgi:predicted phage terminase large subunit-like protein
MTVTLPSGWRTDPKVAENTVRLLRIARDKRNPAKVWATPGELALAVTPTTVQTPALDLIDQAIVDTFNTPDARLILSMPPQEGKSQRVTRTGALWMLTRSPELRIGIASYASSLAETFSGDIRNWISQNSGAEGSLDLRLRLSPYSRSRKVWQLADHRGGVFAVGVGGGLTGRPLDALIIDDPFADAEQATSPAYRQKVWDWWQMVASTRLAPGAPVIVVMTRWHEDDLAGRLIAAEDGKIWRTINIPALADHDPMKGHTDPLGREPGEWMTSARGNRDWDAIRVRSGSRAFSALYQGRPTPGDGNVWLQSWWRRYLKAPWTVNEVQTTDEQTVMHLEGFDELIQSWDMAFKDTKSSDYVVGQLWGRRGADVWLIDQVRDRMTFTETLTQFQMFCAKWPQAKVKLVEDKANGTGVIDMLRSKVGGLVPVNPTESKYARANAVAPFIEAGNVYLPADVIRLFDVDKFLTETSAFPNDPHDDQVDAASQAISRMLLDGSGAAAWSAALRAELAEREAEADTRFGARTNAASETGETAPALTREQLRQQAFMASPNRPR